MLSAVITVFSCTVGRYDRSPFTMPITLTHIVVALVAVFLLKLVAALVRQIRLKKYMPPGPPGLPWLGNVHQLGELPWYRFHEWKQRYGMLMSP